MRVCFNDGEKLFGIGSYSKIATISTLTPRDSSDFTCRII